MAPSPDENATPETAASLTGGEPPGRLSVAVRFRWTSAHPRLEVRSITISGAEVFDQHVTVENGEVIPLDVSLIPFGSQVGWSAVVFVGDVTEAAMAGLSIDVEFKDAAGHTLVRALCEGARAEANRAVQLRGAVDAPGFSDE